MGSGSGSICNIKICGGHGGNVFGHRRSSISMLINEIK